MELLGEVVVFAHLVGFAVVFAAWMAEAAAYRFRFTAVMSYGLLLSLVTGFVLSARGRPASNPTTPRSPSRW